MGKRMAPGQMWRFSIVVLMLSAVPPGDLAFISWLRSFQRCLC
jgi:hypothetical protein